MKIILKIFFLLVLAGFVIIQFFQPEKNLGEQLTENDLVWSTEIPPDLAERVMISCYDCHSDYTRYPLYGYISPVSLIMDMHIREGKEHLNFSMWATLSKKDRIILLSEIYVEVCNGTMPLPVYTRIHKDAKLTGDEIIQLCEWIELETGNIVNGK